MTKHFRQPETDPLRDSRRRFLASFGGAGMSSMLFPGVLWGKIQDEGAQRVTLDMVRNASRIAGLDLDEAQEASMVEGVNESLARIEEIRGFHIDNSVPPPMYFDPRVPGMAVDTIERPFRQDVPSDVSRPANLEDVAFWPLVGLARLIETRQVSAVELTRMYLDRLERYNPLLNCVVTLTSERALEQAASVDADIAAGSYRGLLHGIPWGAKDIIAARGYRTTWGAAPFREQEFDVDATVVERLDAAGAVLVAKLTTGELAFGDRWFGGRTNNPWNPELGSSGSSAGPGAATAAGLVGFGIGTDTGGSILSPSIRCGVVGLRPTFGRVSRFGVMAAGFSLDKIGPMCRTAEDCAIVLDAIKGPDGKDLAVPDNIPFNWDSEADVRSLRVGYFAAAFGEGNDEEEILNNEAALATLRSLGVELRPVTLPRNRLIYFIEYIERAAGFDEFVRSGRVAELRSASRYLYVSRLVPAVDYLQANRVRMLLMQEVAATMQDLDVVVAPYRAINPLTSMTGHPVAAVPSGFRDDGTPTGFTMVGNIYREAAVLRLAKAFQDATDFHLRHPTLDV